MAQAKNKLLIGVFLVFLLGQSCFAQEKCGIGGCHFSDMAQSKSSPLKMFVSFSMPLESLKIFSADLEKVGGVFVLRGIPGNSFKEFAGKIVFLRNLGIHVPFEIDPDAFLEHNIHKVPVLCLKGPKGSDLLVGNVPLKMSLNRIYEEGDNKELAKSLLDLLEKPAFDSHKGAE